jgi:spore coat protein CotH
VSPLWLASLVVAAVLAAPTAAAAAEAPAVAAIYDPGAVAVIDLTFSPEAIESLEDEPDEDVKGSFSFATTDGTPGGEETTLTPAPIAVEAHLKGSIGGSFRPITEKAAFKLKFKKTATFAGLRKLTLNNMVQDDSMLHEALAYATFGAAGVPAPRSGYAYLRVNGEDFGLYADIETLDEIGLEKRFGPFDDPQHLYEGEKGHDVVPGQAAAFEVDEGDDADVSDLEALIEAVDEDGPGPWSTWIAPYADLEEMTKMWAVEKYVDHWDGYSGHALAGLRPNNYYLYGDATGRFQMLPWGTDQTYIPTIGVGTPGREVLFDGEGGVLFDRCLEDDACFRMYWEALSEVTEVAAGLDPAAIATETAALLEPWEELEREDGRPRFTQSQVEAGVDAVVAFSEGRGAEAEAWLAANEPPEEGEQPVGPGQPGAAPAATGPVLTPPAPGEALGLGRARRSGRFLGVQVGAPHAGSLLLMVTMAARKGPAPACAARRTVTAAGLVTLHCKLSPAALAKLAAHALRLELTATLESPGPTLTGIRSIRLPRG